jgi:GNAT superfamily N-acetyltransferase
MTTSLAPETTLRPLGPGDLAAAQLLSAAVGWPYRVEDWAFALGLGRGFALERGGMLAGTAMTWGFGPSWGALGMIIVSPAHQRRGLGRTLLVSAVDELGERSIQLHATAEGEALYRRYGFVRTGSVRQHQGAAFSVGLHAPRPGERIRPAGAADLAVLMALDQAATGMPRAPVIAALLKEASGVVLDREGVASGFALLRRFGRGQVIGPVIAPDRQAAQLLVAHWLGQKQGEFLRIDVTEESGLSPWLEELGLPEVDRVTRMVRGRPAVPAAVQAFGLVSQALG